MLHKNATDSDVLRSYFHASVVLFVLESDPKMLAAPSQQLLRLFQHQKDSSRLVSESHKFVASEFGQLVEQARAQGWTVDTHLLSAQLWRVSWDGKQD